MTEDAQQRHGIRRQTLSQVPIGAGVGGDGMEGERTSSRFKTGEVQKGKRDCCVAQVPPAASGLTDGVA